ncbi:MAG: toprim domain-containing protein [Silvanigrellaceae bacterium]|nr:toprim domain-containing protein [Silvanigrellaceae bacterium]
MKKLSPVTRIAHRFGIKTREYQENILEKARQERIEARRKAFLSRSRAETLEEFPETVAVFDVQDAALRFYSDILIATPTSLNTNRRNQLRAKAAAIEAFDFLDREAEVLPFKREGRQEEAALLRAEELRTLRYELNVSFEENARVNPGIREDAHARYAKFSTAYFHNEKNAIRMHPELAPLVTLKKQATRYFNPTVEAAQIDNTIKDCLNRAIKDLARHIPLPNAEELKLEADALRTSWIGTHSTAPKNLKKNAYQYQGSNLMRELIGKNGIATGWWPYEPSLLEHTERISQIDEVILKEQWVTSFNSQPKEEVLDKFPKLNLLYNKLDAARVFYNEKMASPFAEKAARALIASDFDKLLRNEPLQAVSEINTRIHEQIMENIKHQLQIEGKDASLVESAKPFNHILKTFNRIQESQFNELDASNDSFPDARTLTLVPKEPDAFVQSSDLTIENLQEQIKQLKEQLASRELSEESLESAILNPDNAHESTMDATSKHEILLHTLRSTAPDLPISHLFNGTHLSKVIKSEKTTSTWDIKLLTSVLNSKAEAFVTSLMGAPDRFENGQLRYGSNKGSLIVTVNGNKQGLWFDHQTGEGGNLFQLIQKHENCGFKEALDYAGNYLNLTREQKSFDTIDLSDISDKLDEKKQKSIRYARQLANASIPIKGTLGDTYLAKVRGVDTSVCSDSVRFIASIKEPETGEYHPALLLLGKNLKGQVQGVQAVFLDKEGQKLNCEEPKRSYGVMKGAAVPVHFGGNIYALSEGAETALSIAAANKNLTVFASLGSMTNVSAIDFKPQNNTFIIFADHDKEHKNPRINKEARLKITKAADELLNKGFNVFICKPKEAGKDFNDLLREKGITGVAEEMNLLTRYVPSLVGGLQQTKDKGLQRVKKFEREQGLEF